MADAQYPGGAKAVDEHLGDRITDIARDVRSGFERQERANDRIEQKFDKMVTQSEFSATVQRLDGQDRVIEEKVDSGLSAIRTDMDASLSKMRDEFHSGLSVVSEKVDDGFSAAERQRESGVVKFRWVVGIAVTVVAIANTVLWSALNFFFPA